MKPPAEMLTCNVHSTNTRNLFEGVHRGPSPRDETQHALQYALPANVLGGVAPYAQDAGKASIAF